MIRKMGRTILPLALGGWMAVFLSTDIAVYSAAASDASAASKQELGINPCAPVEDMVFICGIHNPEDLDRFGKTKWVVVSSFQLPQERGSLPGPLYCVDIETHTVKPLFPSDDASIDWDRTVFPDCAAPPELFSSHGLDVLEMGNGVFRIFAVNHGNRESVEIIDVKTDGDTEPVATWRGGVPTPDSIVPNGVVGLPDGGLVVSGGGVAVWRPGKGWQEYENVLARTNGINVSPDGKYLYVNSAEAGTVNRFPIDGKMSDHEVLFDGDFHADNIRWGDDGFLYNAGPSEKEQSVGDCINGNGTECRLGWGVSRIDPTTGKSELLMERSSIPGIFGGATTALVVGDTLWLGTFHGDRIAIVEKP